MAGKMKTHITRKASSVASYFTHQRVLLRVSYTDSKYSHVVKGIRIKEQAE